MQKPDSTPFCNRSLRKLLLILFGCVQLGGQPPAGLRWIAHRGGVVDARYSENSPASLRAAVAHGYWMIECDLREAKDHEIIVNHDEDYLRFYGDGRKVEELTAEEALQLRAEPGGTPPMTLRELAAMAGKHQLRLMLDVKEPEHNQAFYSRIEAQLREAGLLETAYMTGLESAVQYFKGKTKVQITPADLERAVRGGEDVSKLYFVFQWGRLLTDRQVRAAQKLGVLVVPSVNTFHYEKGGRGIGAQSKPLAGGVEPIANGSADLRRLRKLGVTEFQIDSAYEPAFRH